MEQAFNSINARGKFQKVVITIVFLVGLTSMFINIAFPFLTKSPAFYCSPKGFPVEQLQECHKENLCKKEEFNYQINYKESFDNWTLMFGMYCEKEYYLALLGSFYFLGGVLACVFLSNLPDKYGRKKIYQMLIVFSFLIHLSCLLAFSPMQLIVINLFAGFNSFGYSISTLVVTEYLDRNIGGIILSINNSMIEFAGIFAALFYRYVNDTRLLFACTTACSGVCCVLVLYYFVESPHWLNCKGRYSESIESLRKISRVNQTEAGLNQFLESQTSLFQPSKTNTEEKSEKKVETLFTIFTYKSQRKKILILTYIWFSLGFTFYGLLLNLAKLEGELFTMSLMIYVACIVAELSSGWVALEFGRIKGLVYNSYVGGIAFFFYDVLPLSPTYNVFFLFIVSFCFSAAFNIAYLYSCEAFPTSIRSTVNGYFFLISRIGAMAVPSISMVVPRPCLVFAGFSVIAGVFSAFLEETRGKPLEDDVPERLNPEQWERESLLKTTELRQSKMEMIRLDSFSVKKGEHDT